ncbi:MAG: amidohydrolase family protein [Acetobacteraceae bacterium]|nr:amidohydrolase family protein [Acetobacteraceae bacterium]
MNPDRQVIEDGAVAVQGDRIIGVGSTAAMNQQHPSRHVIEANGKAILPGLIDGHSHAGHGLIKTMGGGDSDRWSEVCEQVYTVASTPDFWRAEAMLAALERLKFGVTCGVSLLGGGDAIMRTDDPAHGEAHASGYAQLGLRDIMAVGPTRPPHPRTYARWDGMAKTEYPVTFEQQLETIGLLLERWHGGAGGLIRVATLMPTFHDGEHPDRDLPLSERQGRLVRELGRKHGTLFHQDGHRSGSLARAEQLGLLGADATMSHCTELTEADIEAVVRTDTRIVHNPSAIASVRGRCPVPELLDRGVTVIIGSDATAPDRSADMVRHMFMAMRYHQRHFRDQHVMPPGKVLEMVTIDSARAMGLEAELGSLEAGKKADIITVALDEPHLYPPNMPLYRLACFAGGGDVRDVVCDGRLLMRDRQLIYADQKAILDEAARQTALMLERTGLSHLLATPEGFWGRSRY